MNAKSWIHPLQDEPVKLLLHCLLEMYIKSVNSTYSFYLRQLLDFVPLVLTDLHDLTQIKFDWINNFKLNSCD